MIKVIRPFAFSVTLLSVMMGGVTEPALAQIGLGLNPARAEVEILPGTEKTISFRIESPPADADVRGRLILTPSDWIVEESGLVRYVDPGTLPDSASPWIVFSPSAVTITPGQTQLVRITAQVPPDAKPGVYRTAIFVQERPPAAPPNNGQHVFILRFRYVFTFYVIVPPVAMKGELVDIGMINEGEMFALIYNMKNVGSRHLRPKLSWTVRDLANDQINTANNQDATVLLPFATLKDKAIVGKNLAPGKYEVSAQVDFRDGQAIQAVRRVIEVAPAATGLSVKK